MPKQIQIEKIWRKIERHRLAPKPWDFSYLMMRNNLKIFTRFRDQCLAEVKLHILDVGCGCKPWKKFFEQRTSDFSYVGVDVDTTLAKPDVIAPANRLPFPDNHFDALIYSEVLEHVNDVPGVLSELRRVAKPDTLVFISSPFIFPEHGEPYDFQRLTKFFYEHEFSQDKIVMIKKSNSSVSTVLTIVNYVVADFPLGILTFLKYPVYLATNLLGMTVDKGIELLTSGIGKKYHDVFYRLSLGYAIIIKLNK